MASKQLVRVLLASVRVLTGSPHRGCIQARASSNYYSLVRPYLSNQDKRDSANLASFTYRVVWIQHLTSNLICFRNVTSNLQLNDDLIVVVPQISNRGRFFFFDRIL